MTKERMERGSRLRPLARAVLRTQSDARLVALARDGREAAFEEIVRRYRPGLVAFAAAYAPADRAEDVVQESLVRSWRALGQATEEIHLKPWLYTIVRNRALNARRDAKVHEQLSDEVDGVPQPPEIVLSREELDSVVGAVGALPEPQRQALVRSALEGHTHEQIAAALGSSPGAVRQLIYRARLTLRSGVGMLIPVPLVRLLAEHGAETTAAAATGVAAGGAAIGTVGGVSAMSKVAIVAAAGTIAAGAGVAIDRAKDDRPAKRMVVQQREDSSPAAGAAQGASTPASVDSSGPGPGNVDPSGTGEDRGDDSGEGSDDSGDGSDDSGDGSDDSGEGSDDSGPSASSGPGSGGDDPPEIEEDNSGPGGGGGGGDSGSSSGPGSGDEPLEVKEDNSGPAGSGSSGSGSSGSGSGSSGSSGSGSSGSGSGSGSSGSGSGEPELPEDY